VNEPLVVCVMLTKNRPEMARRAVRSFLAQTYRDKMLLIWDSGSVPFDMGFVEDHLVPIFYSGTVKTAPIGALRNDAARWCTTGPTPYPDIFIHWDDDDTSHPMRIEEQVALLQSSGADVVGYSDMLFWRKCEVHAMKCNCDDAQAWLYRNMDRTRYCLGTSLCYWRKVWEAKPFNPKLPERRGGTGEDTEWLRGLTCVAVPSLRPMPHWNPLHPERHMNWPEVPRMIASIHGSNTQDYKGIEKSGNSWTRVPEWDSYCRKVMER